jgi:integrase
VSLSRLVDPIMDGTGAEVRASDKRSWRIKRLDDHTRRDRTVLHAYVMIGAFSGLRPTEMYNLTWGDVLGYRAGRGKSVDDRDIRLQVRGKGKSGKAIPQKAAILWFDTLWMLFQRSMSREPDDSDPVFASEQGKRIASVANGFTELVKAAGLERDHRGIKRTPCSM